jgi:hypothetical protein
MNSLTTTPSQTLIDNFCHQCGKQLAAQDNFCRSCGTACHGLTTLDESIPITVVSPSGNAQPTAVANSPGDTVQAVLNNRMLVCGIIALIGPLGLPALWFSPRFSKRTKIISTVFYVVLTTVVPLLAAWYFLDFSLRPLVDAFSQRPGQ